MRKFSKILESLDSEIIKDIKDIFVEFSDKDIIIKVEEFQGFFTISLDKRWSDDVKSIDHMQIVSELYISDSKLKKILELEYISSEINLSHFYIKLKYALKNRDTLIDKNVNNWKEFKSYCQNILKVDGIEAKNNDSYYFRINVASEEGFRNKEYFGWEISINDERQVPSNQSREEYFIKGYPGYEDFLRKVLKRKLNWNGVWGDLDGEDHLKSTENNPLGFDKEGIEVVEKLLEMAKDFPSKIRVIKPKI